MALHKYVKDSASAKVIPINDHSVDPIITIQNGTDSTITVTVSLDGDNYAAPVEGAISALATDALAVISNRYKFMSVAGTGTGTVYVMEGG